MNFIHFLNPQKRIKDTMNARSGLSYQKISLAIAIAYAVCIAVFLGLYLRELYANTIWIRIFALWVWIVAPQFILFLYVSKWLAHVRWAQLISMFLQIALCFFLYNYGMLAFYSDAKYTTGDIFFTLPIWHYAIVATTGLVMKIINDY